MPDLGPHLLGRIPSPPDERDYPARAFLSSDPLQKALAALVASKSVPKVTKTWAKLVTEKIDPPSPVPPPGPTPPAPSDKVWSDPEQVLDQGNYGTCVGNGTAQWCNTLPVDDKYTEGMGEPATTGGPYARALYYEATCIDGQPDDPDAKNGGQQGATVRSGMQALKNRGRCSVYASITSVADIKAWLQQKGPVVFGTDWTADMFNPDKDGYIKPTGDVEGGHCWLGLGDLESEDALEAVNSWGSEWGLAGYFKIKWADLETLLNQQGEAWGALELPAS